MPGTKENPDQALKKVLRNCAIRHIGIVYADGETDEKAMKTNLQEFRQAIRDAGYNESELDSFFSLFVSGAEDIFQVIRNAIRGLPADTPFKQAIAKRTKRN